MKGRLDETSPAHVLSEVQLLHVSGIVRLEDGKAVRQIFIDAGGRILFAVSGLPSESMTALFKERGGVPEERLRQAAAAKTPQELLGTTLVRLGHLTRETLDRLTLEHIQHVLRAVIQMSAGSYEFQHGVLPFPDQMNGGLSSAEVLLKWARGVGDLEWLRQRFGSLDVRLVKARVPPEGYQHVPLDPSEGYVMSRVDGAATLGEICLVSPLGEEATLRALYGLVLSGILEAPSGLRPAPPVRTAPNVAPTARAKATAPAATPSNGGGGAIPPGSGTQAASTRPPRPAAVSSRPAPPAPAAPRPVPGKRAPVTGRPRAKPAAPAPADRPPRVAHRMERVEPATISSLETEMLERHARMQDQSLFDVLGVHPGTTPDEMRRAYYDLARNFHPDKFIREEVKNKAEQVFASITEAYSILKSPELRKKYDEELEFRSGVHGKGQSVDPAELARLNFKRGKENFDKGKFFDAVSFLQNACDQDPSRAEYFSYLAQTQAHNPRWKKQAVENLLKAIELSPSDGAPYAHLGTLYARGGLQAKARQMYRQALQWDPTNEEARAGLTPEEGKSKGFLGFFGKK